MNTFYARFGKRALDLILSFLALAALSPLLLLIALWVKLDSPGTVLFKQKRVGRNKTYFQILKFRTMRSDTPGDVPTHQLSGTDRYITRSGAFLRKSSLDELPQLFNILAGQMSIVGPRPALWNQDDLIAQRDLFGANGVTPGLTGWAQVNGRDELPIPVKARYDGEYAKNLSLGMDVKCVLRSVITVLRHEGVVDK